MCQHHDTQQLVRDEIHNHFIRVGEEATASKGDLKEHEARRWAEVEGDEPPQEAPETLDLMDFPLEWPELLSPKFGGCESTILKWVQELVSPDDGVAKVVQWISMYHLLLDFQRATGVVGYKRNADTKQWQVITSWEAMQSYCFCEVTTDFSALLRGVLGQLQVKWHPVPQRPSGGLFRRWIRCARLRVSAQRFQSIDHWLTVHEVVAVQHIGKAFKNLPPFHVSP